MELRKDYLLGRWVIVAPERRKRPNYFRNVSVKSPSKCDFCPGMEKSTPHEIGRVGGKNWRMRWFPNLYPVFRERGRPKIRTKKRFFTFSSNFGRHETIVETPSHRRQLWDFSAEEINELLKVYALRINELSKRKHIRYVVVFKNHGFEAGTSIFHSHTQVAAVGMIPTFVKEKVNACKKFSHCPYCGIIEAERRSPRRCFENRSVVAFAPYASRFNFEVWIFPKRHTRNIMELDESELVDLADAMRKVLKKLKKLNASYNFFLHYAPKGTDLHFHIEVTPRIDKWAGFELASEVIINSVAPEEAARFYRKK
jgi:UDPglucose--hexose-1-phosphate uridylyltransferase